MISSLQSLRFIFAVFIFASHFPMKDGEPQALFPGAGAMGVAFFLVLSGFVMSVGYSDKAKGIDFPDHHWALRLVITFALSVIGSIVVNKYFEQPITKLLSRSSRSRQGERSCSK